MGVTIELDGRGPRVVDTADGDLGPLVDIKTSVGITEWNRETITVATGTTGTAIQFGGVTAGKILILRTDGAVTLKLNGEATGRTVNGIFIWQDAGGSITGATIDNSSGATVTVKALVGG